MKDELETYLEYFDEVELVKECDGYFYNVHDMLKVFVIGLLCGLKNMHEIHEWANEKTIFAFLENRFGITKLPSYYWFTCLLKTINIDSLNKCFMNLAHELIEQARTNSPDKGDETTIAIDGKTIRSTDKMHDYDSPLHIVSALVAEQGITIAQKAVRGKTNEIPIVQELIKELDIRGKTVVADALHCQKKTAQAIIEGKGEYLLSVKSNQLCLYQDIAEYVNDNELRDKMNCDQTSEKNRDRFERRIAYTTTDIGWLDQKEEWKNLRCIGAIHSQFKTKNQTSEEWHYYISSKPLTAQELLKTARKEWSVETMHWLLDVHFYEDMCRVHDATIQQVCNMGRKIALNLIKTYKQKTNSKSSLKSIMLKALINPSFILKILQT